MNLLAVSAYAANKKVHLSVRDEIVEYLTNQLETDNIRILFEVIGFLELRILEHEDRYSSSINRVQLLLQHNNWRIREITLLTLTSWSAVSKNYKKSIFDHIKNYFLSFEEF